MPQSRKPPVPPPQYPKIVTQKLPRRPARAAGPRSGIRRAHVCPPMQLVHPDVIVCLTQEVPKRSSPTLIYDSEKCFAARIPRILAPLAPLDTTREMPPASAFGSIAPNSPVGRTSDDGGMPRTVTPCGAAVVPPLLLSPSCVERATMAPLTIVAQHSPMEPPRRVVVSVCGRPFPAETKDGLETAFNIAEIHRKVALVATFGDNSPVCQFSERLVAKPVRVSVPPPLLVEAESGRGGSKVITEAGGDESHNKDLKIILASLSAAPTLGWPSAIQEAMEDQPELPPQSPVAAPRKTFVPITLEPAPIVLSNPSAAVVAQKEAPRLKAWVIASATHALEDFTAKSNEGNSAATEPPPSIMRRALEPIWGLQVATEVSSPRQILSASCRSCRWSRNPWYPKQQRCDLGEASEDPVWRDWSTDSEIPDAPCLSPEQPVWRDSEEDSEEFVEKGTFPLRQPVWKAKERLHSTAPQRQLRPEVPPSLSSVSPLGALLRRRHEPRSGLGIAKGKDKHPLPPSDGIERSAKLAFSRRGRPQIDQMGPGKPWSVVLDPARVSVMMADAWAGDLGHGNTTKRGGVTLYQKQEWHRSTTRGIISDVVPFPLPSFTPDRIRELVQIRRKTPSRQRYQHSSYSGQGKTLVFKGRYNYPYRDICLTRAAIALPLAKTSARQAVASPSKEPALPRGNASVHRKVPSLLGMRGAGLGQIVGDAVIAKKKQMKAPAFGPSRVRHTRRTMIPTKGCRVKSAL